MGDLRNVILAAANTDPLVFRALQYRFKTTSDLNEHTVGNLLFTALFKITGSMDDTVKALSHFLEVGIKILPLTEDNLTLMAHTKSNKVVCGEKNIGVLGSDIDYVYYDKEPKIIPEVLTSIANADLVILSMGSLFTSIIPNLLSEEMKIELANSKAKIMYVANYITQPGETDGYTVSDHIQKLNEYLKLRAVDAVVVANSNINQDVIKRYKENENKKIVKIDHDKLRDLNIEVIEDDIIKVENNVIRHDELKLGLIVTKYIMDL